MLLMVDVLGKYILLLKMRTGRDDISDIKSTMDV